MKKTLAPLVRRDVYRVVLLRRGLHDTAAVTGGSPTDLHKLLYSPLLTPDAPAAEDPVAARNALQAALSRVRTTCLHWLAPY